MLKSISKTMTLLALFSSPLYSITEQELASIAKAFKTSVVDIKKTISTWKKIQSIQDAINAYKQNKLHETLNAIVPLENILKKHPEITYIKVQNPQTFNYAPFPLSHFLAYQPTHGTFAESFILKIPNGTVYSRIGFIEIDSKIIKELLSQNYPHETFALWQLQCNRNSLVPRKIPGRVLVITRNDHDCYGHWLAEIITRLLMAQQAGIEFDWIYVPYTHDYIKQSLMLLGIDKEKIIEPARNAFCIQADELIVPSLPSYQIPSNQITPFTGYYPATFYCPNWTIDLLRNNFLPMLTTNDTGIYCSKIFISRQDAGQRRMINEDEIFALFKQKGFVRYRMTDLTFLQQIALFHNATHIVAAHGSALTNLIFCKPGTKVFEIFQNQFDNGFWQLSDQIGLKHTCIQTQKLAPGSWKVDTTVPISIIKTYCDQISD